MFSRGLRVFGGVVGAIGSATVAFSSGAAAPSKVKLCRPIVVCGPSGVGKGTLIQKLRSEFPADYGFSVSHTTRAPRPGEAEGIDYHFVSQAEIERAIAAGEFIEHATVHGNTYGTSHQAVSSVSEKCVVCVLDIDIQGVKSVRKAGLDVDKYIFIAPPSIKDLEARLKHRGTETDEKIAKRVANAAGEMDEAAHIPWDAYIVNGDLEKAYAAFRAATEAGRKQCATARK